jgi:hypothetical protein
LERVYAPRKVKVEESRRSTCMVPA